MSIRDLGLKVYYNNDYDDLVDDFYNPVLEQAILYKRATGFFSSSSFWEIIEGLKAFFINDGKIKLIVSPEISEQDIEAINLGIIAKEDVINSFIISKIFDSNKYKNQFNLLAWLIYEEKLEIKFVTKKNFNSYGIFHDKSAVIYDKYSDRIAFHGSLNESNTAYSLNYESINVFMGWNEADNQRIKIIEEAFDNIWENKSKNWISYSIPESIKNDIVKIKSIDRPVIGRVLYNNNFLIPKNYQLRDYQKEAIDKWFENRCKGILEMATGSGKTFTAIFAMNKLMNRLKEKGYGCGMVIVVPYKNLLEQWSDELSAFGVSPIKCYDSKLIWYYKARNAINDYNIGIAENLFLIVTNYTFITKSFQEILGSIKRDYIFCADEAHHLISNSISKLLPLNTEFRLGLTATLNNEFDEEKVIPLINYYDKIVFKFSLKEAMEHDCLTKYYYYPIFIELDESEMQEYIDLSKRISKLFNNENSEDVLKALLNKRRRIILNATNKIIKFNDMKSEIGKFNKVLVYCGDKKDEDGKFVDKINKMVSDMGFSTHTYTADVNNRNRKSILDRFKNGDINVLTAIRCLDEGIDIPSLDCAFILASNADSKQFIQRRGRILRKSPNKDFAYIYDFVVIPTLDRCKIESLCCEDRKYEVKIVSNELKRVLEFSKLCENKIQAIAEVTKIISLYTI